MKASKLGDLLDEVKAGLGQPIPPHTLTRKDIMAKKVDKKEEAKPAKGKAVAKEEKTSKKAAKPAADEDEGVVTLATLAEEAEISPAAARRKVRALELERDGRWAWKEGSKQLRTVREALGLDKE